MENDQSVTPDTTPAKPAAPIENINEIPSGDGPGEFDAAAALGEMYITPVDAPYGVRADGTPRAKPGRKKGQVSAAAAGTVAGSASSAPRVRSKSEVKAHEASSQEIARAMFATFALGMSGLVGPEWEPQSQQEADGMRAALAAYIEAKGEGKVSPETMLLMVVAGYSLSRFGHENTRSKFGRVWDKLAGFAKRAYGAFFKG